MNEDNPSNQELHLSQVSLKVSQITNAESENLDEKRSSEILSPNQTFQKTEFMKPSYQVENPIQEKNSNMETPPLNENPPPLNELNDKSARLSEKKPIEKILQAAMPDRKKSHEEIIDEAYVERKKISFIEVKKWDENKQKILMTHRNFLDNMVIKLEKKMDFSLASLQKLLKFFKEKISHETENCNFIKQKLPKIGEIFTETLIPKDSKHPPEKIMHFSDFTSNLNLHDDFQSKNIKNITFFIEFLEKNICKDLLGTMIQEFPKRVGTLKEKIITLRKQLQKVNVEVVEKSMKHSKLYHSMIEASYQRPKKVKDLYNLQLQFLEKANIQISLHRKLGREVLNYWHELLKLQCEVLTLIQKTFNAYLTNLIKTYGVSAELEVSLKKFDELDCIKAAEDEFLIETIVSKEETAFIKKTLNEGKIDEIKLKLSDLEKFFEGFEIKKLKEKPLVMKEILAERDIGGISKKFSDCLIVFTVDRNILLFDDNKEETGANFALKIEHVNIKEKIEKDIGFIEITEKVPGLLFNSKQNFLIRTKSKDNYEEFVDYIKLIVKKTG